MVEAGFDLVIAVGGAPAQALVGGAIAAGLPPTSVVALPTSEEAAELARQLVKERWTSCWSKDRGGFGWTGSWNG